MIRRKDDSANSHLLDCGLEKDKHDSMVYLKQQGMVAEEEPDLALDDYVLIIQTLHQKDMLIRFGHKGVCLDSTKCSDKFFLFTIVVVDEFASAIPICHMLSTRSASHELMQLLYRKIGSELGEPMNPTWFLLDNEQYSHKALRKELRYRQLVTKTGAKLDELVSALLLRDRRLFFMRLRRLALGSDNGIRLNQIEKDHVASEKLSIEDVMMAENGEYLVKSCSCEHYYAVSRIQEAEAGWICADGDACQLRCRTCRFCAHTYSCTCDQFMAQHSDTCKHIHLVGRLLSLASAGFESEDVSRELECNTEERLEWGQAQATNLFQETVSKISFDLPKNSIDAQKRKLTSLCAQLRDLMERMPSEEGDLSDVVENLQQVVTALQAKMTQATRAKRRKTAIPRRTVQKRSVEVFEPMETNVFEVDHDEEVGELEEGAQICVTDELVVSSGDTEHDYTLIRSDSEVIHDEHILTALSLFVKDQEALEFLHNYGTGISLRVGISALKPRESILENLATSPRVPENLHSFHEMFDQKATAFLESCLVDVRNCSAFINVD